MYTFHIFTIFSVWFLSRKIKLKNINWAKIIAASDDSEIKMYLVRADRANRENYFFLQLYSLIVMYAFSCFPLAICSYKTVRNI